MNRAKFQKGDEVNIKVPRLKGRVGVITKIYPRISFHRYEVIYGERGAFRGDELERIEGDRR